MMNVRITGGKIWRTGKSGNAELVPVGTTLRLKGIPKALQAHMEVISDVADDAEIVTARAPIEPVTIEPLTVVVPGAIDKSKADLQGEYLALTGEAASARWSKADLQTEIDKALAA